jgi:hypothetical protein
LILGRWDESFAAARQLIAGPADLDAAVAAAWASAIASARGDRETMDRCREIARERQGSAHIDERVAVGLVLAHDAIERRDAAQALQLARAALEEPTTGYEFLEEAYAIGIEAATELSDSAGIDALIEYVDGLRPAHATPLLRAGRTRLQAERAHRRGQDDAAEELGRDAIAQLRSLGAQPLLARALLERNRRHGDEDALAEARAILADLGATEWLMRIDEPSGLAA